MRIRRSFPFASLRGESRHPERSEGSPSALLMAFEDPSPSSRLRMTNCVATAASAVGGRSGRRYTSVRGYGERGVEEEQLVAPHERIAQQEDVRPLALVRHQHVAL